MKKFMVLMVLAVLSAGFIGCSGGGSSTNQVNNNNNNKGSGDSALFLAVKATTPTFTATVSAAPALKAMLYSAQSFTDQSMNLAFQLLRDYSYPADEGKVDMTNIYKVLHEAGGYLDNATSVCSPMSLTTDSSISSYAFSDFLGHSYDCGGTNAESGGYGSSLAYRDSGGTKYMLATYKWAPDSTQQIAIGAIQASYNPTTNDVELTFAQSVNYPANSQMGGATGSGFATRTYIKGNASTHAFELKLAMPSNGGGGTSLVGKGVSQGAGNFFLIRNGSDYYCLPAGATEDDLRSVATTTQGGVSADCAGYVSGVDSMTAYDVSDPAQVPGIDLADFNLGVAGTPVHYLMFP